MVPLGKTCTTPERSRSTMVRKLICSTRPPVPLMMATSPTRTWFSRIMKKPEITSRTRFWAPKPMARPAIPALASSGAISTPTSRKTTSPTTSHSTISTAWRSRRTRVSARLTDSLGTSPSTFPRSISWVSRRRSATRTTFISTQKTTRISRMRRAPPMT